MSALDRGHSRPPFPHPTDVPVAGMEAIASTMRHLAHEWALVTAPGPAPDRAA